MMNITHAFRAGSTPVRHLLCGAIVAALGMPATAAGMPPVTALRGVAVGLRDTVTAEIGTPGDLDTFVFDAVAGTSLSITLRSHSSPAVAPIAYLVDAQGRSIDVAPRTRRKKDALRWKNVTLPDTGSYAIVVAADAGKTGGYRLRLRGKPPTKRALKGLRAALGHPLRVAYGVSAGTLARIRVRATTGSFAITDVECPTGEADVEAFDRSRSGARARARIRNGATFGERAFSVEATALDTLLDISLRFAHPRENSRAIVPGDEPVITSLSPSTAKPGDRVTVNGRRFIDDSDGAPAVFFGAVAAVAPTFVSSTRIEVTVPAGEGVASVVLHNPDGQEARAPVAFRYANDVVEETPYDGLVTHWEFNATRGSAVVDETGGGITGAVTGGATWTGDALDFDGFDDHVTYRDILDESPRDVGNLRYGTISTWVRYDDVKNGEETAESLPILYYGVTGDTFAEGGTDSLSVYIGHTGMEDPDKRQIYLTIIADDDIQLCFDSGEISLEPGRWYHYAVTIGPDGHHGYLDGVEFERDYNAGTSASDYAFFASITDPAELLTGYGWLGITGRWWHFNGQIGDVRVYDRVLAPIEVAELAATR